MRARRAKDRRITSRGHGSRCARRVGWRADRAKPTGVTYYLTTSYRRPSRLCQPCRSRAVCHRPQQLGLRRVSTHHVGGAVWIWREKQQIRAPASLRRWTPGSRRPRRGAHRRVAGRLAQHTSRLECWLNGFRRTSVPGRVSARITRMPRFFAVLRLSQPLRCGFAPPSGSTR